MKKQTPFLDYYEIAIQNQERSFFMCPMFRDHDAFKLVIPTREEKQEHYRDGYGFEAWGSHGDDEGFCDFNAFRQTIILLCAAINGEL